MLAKVIIKNGQKKIQALTADTGTGAPVGSYLYLEKKSNPQGYLYCDGSTFDETVYPALYQYLGTNVLPDWREFSAVGAEQNTTNVYDAQTNPNGVIHDHDVYVEGEAKDDQLQNITGNFESANRNRVPSTSGVFDVVLGTEVWFALDVQATTSTIVKFNASRVARAGTVTRGKSRAVFIYIKATSGLTENQQENVLNTINDNLSYSTTEHKTGKKWIDGKDIYRRVFMCTTDLAFEAETWYDLCSYFNGLTGTVATIDTLVDVKSHIAKNYVRNYQLVLKDHPSSGALGFLAGIPNSFRANGGFIIIEYTKTTD